MIHNQKRKSMTSLVEEKTKQVLAVQEMLSNSTISTGHDSTQEPFFNRPEEQKVYAMDHVGMPEVPDALNRHIKIMYELIGNPDSEVYIGQWTIMSLNKVLENYKQYCSDGQDKVFDIAFKYAGMGHVVVLSCDLSNHLLFKRHDGGANGFERQANYDATIAHKTLGTSMIFFAQWKAEIMQAPM